MHLTYLKVNLVPTLYVSWIRLQTLRPSKVFVPLPVKTCLFVILNFKKFPVTFWIRSSGKHILPLFTVILLAAQVAIDALKVTRLPRWGSGSSKLPLFFILSLPVTRSIAIYRDPALPEASIFTEILL